MDIMCVMRSPCYNHLRSFNFMIQATQLFHFLTVMLVLPTFSLKHIFHSSSCVLSVSHETTQLLLLLVCAFNVYVVVGGLVEETSQDASMIVQPQFDVISIGRTINQL